MVRGLASALAERAAPESSLRTELEAVLTRHVGADFKEFLRDAPFDDTDIPRDRDPGRDVEL